VIAYPFARIVGSIFFSGNRFPIGAFYCGTGLTPQPLTPRPVPLEPWHSPGLFVFWPLLRCARATPFWHPHYSAPSYARSRTYTVPTPDLLRGNHLELLVNSLPLPLRRVNADAAEEGAARMAVGDHAELLLLIAHGVPQVEIEMAVELVHLVAELGKSALQSDALAA
jgi:hypothetical protein